MIVNDGLLIGCCAGLVATTLLGLACFLGNKRKKAQEALYGFQRKKFDRDNLTAAEIALVIELGMELSVQMPNSFFEPFDLGPLRCAKYLNVVFGQGSVAASVFQIYRTLSADQIDTFKTNIRFNEYWEVYAHLMNSSDYECLVQGKTLTME